MRRDLKDQDSLSDLQLIERAKHGHEEAFRALIDRHADGLYRFARAYVPTHQDAEDVTQETFIAAFGALRSFKGTSSVKTWLYSILIRQAALWRRKRRSPLKFFREDAALSITNAPGELPSVDARLDLQTALEQLPEDHRAILVLREFDGLGYQEIADLLQLPRGTVESRLSRARLALRDWMIAHSGEVQLPAAGEQGLP